MGRENTYIHDTVKRLQWLAIHPLAPTTLSTGDGTIIVMKHEPHIVALIAKHRRSLRGTLLKVTVYYAILAATIALAVFINPDVVEQLPVGGVGDMVGYSTSNLLELEDALLSADGDELEDLATATSQARLERAPLWMRDSVALLTAMVATLILMFPVAWVYKAIHEDSFYDHSIDTTALVLPAVVAGIVTIVQHSLALAFSLAGIVAGVRFRRSLSDTFDTLFILSAIGVGIAAGVRSIEVAVIMTVFFNYAAIMVCMYGDGLESQHVVQRKLEKQRAKAANKQLRKIGDHNSPVTPNP